MNLNPGYLPTYKTLFPVLRTQTGAVVKQHSVGEDCGKDKLRLDSEWINHHQSGNSFEVFNITSE
jgi:hypothetical protein